MNFVIKSALRSKRTFLSDPKHLNGSINKSNTLTLIMLKFELIIIVKNVYKTLVGYNKKTQQEKC